MPSRTRWRLGRDIPLVEADEAARLLDEGASRAAGTEQAVRTEATAVPVVESSRSFQTRLGTALATFNGCLQERGFQFVGLPARPAPPSSSSVPSSVSAPSSRPSA
ncbi:MAG: hypothetical protein OEV40_02390 [Acidimicrobiia bacterium]|nr:hypothetical protein [Acidimicrobiia bacterium]